MAAALRGQHPDWTLDLAPLADGGEGCATILTQAAKGREVTGEGRFDESSLEGKGPGAVAARALASTVRAVFHHHTGA